MWLVTAALLVVAGVLVAARRRGDDPAAVALAAKARAEARAAGFKLGFEEFDLVLDEPARRRAAAVTNAGSLLAREPWLGKFEWMQPAAPGAAIAGWQQDGQWPEAAAAYQEFQPELEAAVAALLEPAPFRCEPILGEIDHLAPHLPPLKQLAHALPLRMALDLRAGRIDAAWTNLLAVNRLAASYQPEPFTVSVVVRGGLADVAFAASWEALRTNAWSDAQLATLAELWKSVSFWENATETPATHAAELLAIIRRDREEARTHRWLSAFFNENNDALLTDPVGYARHRWELVRVRRLVKLWVRRDSRLDEAILIGFFRARQAELRNAAAQSNWPAMRSLPGVTNQNLLTLTTNAAQSMQALVNMQAMQLRFMLDSDVGTRGLPEFLARLECRRRVLLAALAVERFRLGHSRLPASLDELPGILPDFADGAPLRYRPAPDGTFVLYSIGTDGVDDGGTMSPPDWEHRRPRTRDLVWPRLATAEEAERAQARRDAPNALVDPSSGVLLRFDPPPNRYGVRFPEE